MIDEGQQDQQDETESTFDSEEGEDRATTTSTFFHNRQRQSTTTARNQQLLEEAIAQEDWEEADSLIDVHFANLVVDDVVEQVQSKISREVNTVAFWNLKRITQRAKAGEIVTIQFIPLFERIRERVFDTLKYKPPAPERVVICGISIRSTTSEKVNLTREQKLANQNLGYTINMTLDRVFGEIKTTYTKLNNLHGASDDETDDQMYVQTGFVGSKNNLVLDQEGGELLLNPIAPFRSTDFADLDTIMKLKKSRSKITSIEVVERRKQKSAEKAIQKKVQIAAELRAKLRAEILAEIEADQFRGLSQLGDNDGGLISRPVYRSATLLMNNTSPLTSNNSSQRSSPRNPSLQADYNISTTDNSQENLSNQLHHKQQHNQQHNHPQQQQQRHQQQIIVPSSTAASSVSCPPSSMVLLQQPATTTSSELIATTTTMAGPMQSSSLNSFLSGTSITLLSSGSDLLHQLFSNTLGRYQDCKIELTPTSNLRRPSFSAVEQRYLSELAQFIWTTETDLITSRGSADSTVPFDLYRCVEAQFDIFSAPLKFLVQKGVPTEANGNRRLCSGLCNTIGDGYCAFRAAKQTIVRDEDPKVSTQRLIEMDIKSSPNDVRHTIEQFIGWVNYRHKPLQNLEISKLESALWSITQYPSEPNPQHCYMNSANFQFVPASCGVFSFTDSNNSSNNNTSDHSTPDEDDTNHLRWGKLSVVSFETFGMFLQPGAVKLTLKQLFKLCERPNFVGHCSEHFFVLDTVSADSETNQWRQAASEWIRSICDIVTSVPTEERSAVAELF